MCQARGLQFHKEKYKSKEKSFRRKSPHKNNKTWMTVWLWMVIEVDCDCMETEKKLFLFKWSHLTPYFWFSCNNDKSLFWYYLVCVQNYSGTMNGDEDRNRIMMKSLPFFFSFQSLFIACHCFSRLVYVAKLQTYRFSLSVPSSHTP